MSNKAFVTLRGTVMQNPDVKTDNNGKTKMRLNVAVQTTKKDPAPKNPKFPYLSDYYNVYVYGAVADNLLKFYNISAGSKVVVLGPMYMGEPYTKQDGTTVITPIVNAVEAEVTGSTKFGNNNNNNNRNNNYNNNNNNNNNNSVPVTEYEEAPF